MSATGKTPPKIRLGMTSTKSGKSCERAMVRVFIRAALERNEDIPYVAHTISIDDINQSVLHGAKSF